VEVIIPVAILFGIGFGAGFGVRMLMARKAEQQAAIAPAAGQPVAIMPPSFKPRSSLRAFDLREDPLWGR
jgi:hypothetical protein